MEGTTHGVHRKCEEVVLPHRKSPHRGSLYWVASLSNPLPPPPSHHRPRNETLGLWRDGIAEQEDRPTRKSFVGADIVGTRNSPTA